MSIIDLPESNEQSCTEPSSWYTEGSLSALASWVSTSRLSCSSSRYWLLTSLRLKNCWSVLKPSDGWTGADISSFAPKVNLEMIRLRKGETRPFSGVATFV